MTSSTFLEFATKSTAVWLVVWAAAPLLRHSSAAFRHLVWTLAFASSVVVLGTIVFGPVWQVVPGASHEDSPAAVSSTTSATVSAVATGSEGIDPTSEQLSPVVFPSA
jgi:hypothetical protein